MNIFPVQQYMCTLSNNDQETWDRLSSNTKYSKNQLSSHTDKKFIGIAEVNYFKLISSEIGKGAFCVSEGIFHDSKNEGVITFTVHKAFRILISVWLLFALAGIVESVIENGFLKAPINAVMLVGFLFLLRYVLFIFFAFQVERRIQTLRYILRSTEIQKIK